MTHDTAPEPGDLTGRRRLRGPGPPGRRRHPPADPPGAYTVLPDERSLGQQFDASRNTIRDALDLLRADGLIERQQGVGTIVVARMLEQLHGQPLGVADIGMEAVDADPHSAMISQVPRGSALLLVERLSHFSSGRPIDLEFIRFRGDRLTMRTQVPRA
jgi:DNA-binding GntR family transcriptional regulator